MSSAPRPAATVALLREATAALEVFLLQRTRGAAFLAGAYVFPGGAIDDQDADPRIAQRVVGLADGEASARLGIASGGLAYWVAAVRECFEEAGILIACDEHERPVSAARAAALEHLRAPLNAGELSFAEFLERERLIVPAQQLAYFGHWITAPGRSRRFDTRFFVALAPQGQAGSHDNSETIHNLWLQPQQRSSATRKARSSWCSPPSTR